MVRKIIEFLKGRKLIILIVILVVIISCFLFCNLKMDNMKSINDIKIFYRTYTSDDGWTRWAKNGRISGKENGNEIKNIQIKTSKKYSDYIIYSAYSDQYGWMIDNDEIKKSKITGIKIDLFGTISRKYDICYRTYNKDNKWLNWSCNNETNGNKNASINALQIKIIPKNSIKSEYLEDFLDYDENRSINF